MPKRYPLGTPVKHAKHGKGKIVSYDQCDDVSCGVDFDRKGQWCIAMRELIILPNADERLARTACSAWRDPETDPPTKTGKILIWIEGIGPSIVNVEERWMCYWNGNDETEPTAPYEWDWWMEISPPNVQSGVTGQRKESN